MKTKLSYVKPGDVVRWGYTIGLLVEARVRGINETLDPAGPGDVETINAVMDQLVAVAPDEFGIEGATGYGWRSLKGRGGKR